MTKARKPPSFGELTIGVPFQDENNEAMWTKSFDELATCVESNCIRVGSMHFFYRNEKVLACNRDDLLSKTDGDILRSRMRQKECTTA